MDDIVKRLRLSKETTYGALLNLFGAVLWAVLVFAVLSSPEYAAVIIAYIVIGLLGSLLAAAFYRAYVFGHYVLIGPAQFPHLAEMVREGAAALGMKEAPKTFLYNSNGLINAFAMRLIGGPYVMLTSSLIDADTDAQVRFVIGHELGHHAAGHLSFRKNLVKFPGHFIPFLGPAYSRARELTCDRIGAYLSQDLEASRGALQMLACGSARLNSQLNRHAFEEQEEMVPPFFGFLTLIFSHYPRLTTRVTAISVYFQNPGVSAAR